MAEPGSADGASSATGRFNHRAWIGPLVAIFGLLSYFTLFYRWPLTRDLPWLNLLILLAAIGVSLTALPRARSTAGRVGGGVGLFVSVALAGLLCFYVFSLSYRLPDAGRVVDDGTRLPEISLASARGEAVDVAAAARDKLILVFYRGHW